MLLPAQYALHATPTALQTFQEQRWHFAITRCVSFKTADRTEAVAASSGSPMRSLGRANPGNENANVNNSTGISRAMTCMGSQHQPTAPQYQREPAKYHRLVFRPEHAAVHCVRRGNTATIALPYPILDSCGTVPSSHDGIDESRPVITALCQGPAGLVRCG